MRQIFLLKSYEGNGVGEIISVSANVAFGLIDRGIARECNTKDFLVKPEFSNSTNRALDSRLLNSRKKIKIRRG